MKKIVALLLAVMMVLSLAACGSKTTTTTTTTKKADTATTTAPQGSTEASDPTKFFTRPVNVTVCASAGGATDIIVRAFATKFQEITGQPMVITNVSGTAGYNSAKTADADGYNYVTMGNSFLTYKAQGKVSYTWDEAYDSAAVFGVSNTCGIVVRADSKYQTINDLVEDAKTNKNITLGGGSGVPYYWKLCFDQATGVEIYTTALGDTNELNVALLGKQVDGIVTRWTAVKSYIESGDFRMLCIAAENRDEKFDYVPTCKEQGIDYVFSDEMSALMCPKGTPMEAREAMNAVFKIMCEDQEFKAYMISIGGDTSYMTIAELDDLITRAQADMDTAMALANK